jgi:hypothetical protein
MHTSLLLTCGIEHNSFIQQIHVNFMMCVQGAPDAATIMAKTAAAFLKFLNEAALFYKRLVMQLQVGMQLPGAATDTQAAAGCDSIRRMALACNMSSHGAASTVINSISASAASAALSATQQS